MSTKYGLIMTGDEKGTKPPITTGNAVFAECPRLCRVLNIGRSAKRFFAECYTRQRKTHGKVTLCRVPGARQTETLGKDYFAECQALGKQKHSAKTTLPSVGHSAKRDTRQTSAT
jgi:hypothetical protein